MALKWLEKLGGDKKERILILLLAGVLLLVIVIPTGQEGGEMTETGDSVQVVSDDTGRAKEEALEQRLAAVLAQGVGIGKVEVMITLKSNGRQIVEKDMEQQHYHIVLVTSYRLQATSDTLYTARSCHS